MKINGTSINKIANVYNTNKKVSDKNDVKLNKDTIQISPLGKSLSAFATQGSDVNSSEKIESLRNQISQGTYKANSSLTAKKMIDIIKGRGI